MRIRRRIYKHIDKCIDKCMQTDKILCESFLADHDNRYNSNVSTALHAGGYLSTESCVVTVMSVWHLAPELLHAWTFIKSGNQASHAETCWETGVVVVLNTRCAVSVRGSCRGSATASW